MQRPRALRFYLGLVLLVGIYGVALVALDPRVELTRAAEADAIRSAAQYLVSHLDGEGRFAYLARLDGAPPPAEYNVLRHAGTIYSLALYREMTGDHQVDQSILRATRYLLRRHVRPVRGLAGKQAVFSLPGEELQTTNAQVKLGGCALGLVALLKAREVDTNVVSVQVLQQIGEFIVLTQEANGHFRSKYDETHGWVENFDSSYYPGEAILALSLLHRVDPNPGWLQTALRGAKYLIESRKDLRVNQLPNDHWLMIATAALLPACSQVPAPPISSQRLVDHITNIGRMMMHEQNLVSCLPGLRGAFTPDGSSTSSATRLEGLAALCTLLPPDHPDQKRLHSSIHEGLRYVLAAQVKAGAAKGGFTGTLPGWHVSSELRQAASEIRIDYVQHALSALLAHARFPED